MTRRTRTTLALGAVCVAVAGGVLWGTLRALPVAETRRFLTAPVEVGDAPVEPAPAGRAQRASAEQIEQRYDAAKAAFADGSYADAAESFAWVVAQDPQGPHAGDAQWNLTRSRLRTGDGTAALASLDALLRHHGAYLAERAPKLREGLQHMEDGDLARAQASFEAMTREQPDSDLVPLAHALIARIHWTHGEPVETVRAFGRMFASVKDDVPAYKRLAQSLDRYADGDEDMPATFQSLADAGDPGFRDVYQYLAARSLLEQGRFEATQGALEELRRRYPDGDFGHIVDLEHAWNLLRHGQAQEALAMFHRLEATTTPERAQAFDEFFDLRAELPLGIARCHLALGQYAEAAAAFERAFTTRPAGIYNVENRLGLALAYEKMGRWDDAARTLRAVIDDNPSEPKLWALRQQLARVEAHGTAR